MVDPSIHKLDVIHIQHLDYPRYPHHSVAQSIPTSAMLFNSGLGGLPYGDKKTASLLPGVWSLSGGLTPASDSPNKQSDLQKICIVHLLHNRDGMSVEESSFQLDPDYVFDPTHSLHSELCMILETRYFFLPDVCLMSYAGVSPEDIAKEISFDEYKFRADHPFDPNRCVTAHKVVFAPKDDHIVNISIWFDATPTKLTQSQIKRSRRPACIGSVQFPFRTKLPENDQDLKEACGNFICDLSNCGNCSNIHGRGMRHSCGSLLKKVAIKSYLVDATCCVAKLKLNDRATYDAYIQGVMKQKQGFRFEDEFYSLPMPPNKQGACNAILSSRICKGLWMKLNLVSAKQYQVHHKAVVLAMKEENNTAAMPIPISDGDTTVFQGMEMTSFLEYLHLLPEADEECTIFSFSVTQEDALQGMDTSSTWEYLQEDDTTATEGDMVASLSVSHSDFMQEMDAFCWEYLQEDANLQEGATIAALLCEDDYVT